MPTDQVYPGRCSRMLPPDGQTPSNPIGPIDPPAGLKPSNRRTEPPSMTQPPGTPDPGPTTADPQPRPLVERPAPLWRVIVAGVLMGAANAVPGVSGGTMVLVMGLYPRFVNALADLTRLRALPRHLPFIALLGACAAITLWRAAGPMAHLVATQRSLMYAIFIGLTLGGSLSLWRMIRRISPAATACFVLGFSLMAAVAQIKQQDKPDKQALLAEGTIAQNIPLDLAGGVLAMGAMILPGISGSQMLLVLGRYESIMLSIHHAGLWAKSAGSEGDLSSAVAVLVPVALGAVAALLLLSMPLKWLLAHHERLTAACLLGLLWGTPLTIWPLTHQSTPADYAIVAFAILAGAAAVLGLELLQSRLARPKD